MRCYKNRGPSVLAIGAEEQNALAGHERLAHIQARTLQEAAILLFETWQLAAWRLHNQLIRKR